MHAKIYHFYAGLAPAISASWTGLPFEQLNLAHKEEWDSADEKRCPLLSVMVSWNFSSRCTVKLYP